MSKVAVVIGASGGIGSEIARALSEEKYFVASVYNKDNTSAEKLKSFENSIAVKCDISNENDVKLMINKVIGTYGKIDALINCASPEIRHSRFLEKDLKLFSNHMDVTFFGAMNCIRSALPYMIKQKSGNILNILTENVVGKPQSGVSDYVCAKYALLGLTKTLAVEYAGKNIRVNAISPGMVETKMLKNLPPKAIEITKETTPLGKLTTPNDIANAVLFLISDRAANITGVNLVICGGTSMN